MRIDCAPDPHLLYICYGVVGRKAVRTFTVAPLVQPAFAAHSKLVGIGILDALKIFGKSAQIEVTLPSVALPLGSESG